MLDLLPGREMLHTVFSYCFSLDVNSEWNLMPVFSVWFY